MTTRRACSIAVISVLVSLVAACAPAPSPEPGSPDPTTTTSTSTTSTTASTTTTTTTTTTTVPLPASIDLVLSQPSHGDGVKVIGGQSAPLEYVLTVTNSGDAPSGPIVVTDSEHRVTTLVTDSPSCGTTPGCSVVVADAPLNPWVGRAITWSIDDVAPRSSVELSFAATVDDQLEGFTSLVDQPYVTNVNTPNCTTPTCARNAVTNPVEPFRFEPGGGFWPRNSVFYSGPGYDLTAAGWETNDPEAEIVSYRYRCVPELLCQLGTPNEPTTSTYFLWDYWDHSFFTIYLTVTATRGDDTIIGANYMDFRLEYLKCYENGDILGPLVACPWDTTGPNGELLP